jgi:glyoxylase-like metal-dependent hydrolase (beta-lactamase superfamily II)
VVRSITFLEAGFTEQYEKIVNPVTGAWRKIKFPSTVALIEHPREGYLLFDAGYSGRFQDVTRRFPEKLYAWVTPVTVTPETSAVGRLKALGLSETDISRVILSHFHADHIGGAADFTRARYVASKREFDQLNALGAISQVKHGFLKALLPESFEARVNWSDEFPVRLPELGDGWTGSDLLGDGSVFLVPLPGHTVGQMGLFIPSVKGWDYLLVADAAWLTPSFREDIAPMRVTDLIFHDAVQYRQTLSRIHQLDCALRESGRLRILTCHCEVAMEQERNRVV